jgi:ribulose bisphosphate carboxylase small subunit
MTWAAEQLELFLEQGWFVGASFLEVEETSTGSTLRTRYAVQHASGWMT